MQRQPEARLRPPPSADRHHSAAFTCYTSPLPTKLPLSVFIIALNAADRIGPVILAVRDWADKVLVVDSGQQRRDPDAGPVAGCHDNP
ncbi:hypothetical protein [Niveispirillum lacus]|uniref:hypothetical protein n=1 Tax=Niveispirillum lacus TaxID=1981099 RepID=UPI001A9CAFA0|nr:hypothetical protein [Niveispirillum lacus]